MEGQNAEGHAVAAAVHTLVAPGRVQEDHEESSGLWESWVWWAERRVEKQSDMRGTPSQCAVAAVAKLRRLGWW